MRTCYFISFFNLRLIHTEYGTARKKVSTYEGKTATKDVYDYYALRWEIETVFRMYKDILSLNTTRVHDDCSVIGTEFVNYLSSIITCKMKSMVKEQGLFKEYTLRDITGRLSDMVMVSTDTKDDKWSLCNLSKADLKLKEALGV